MQDCQLCIDSAEYSRELDYALENSTQSIYMQFLTFECDSVGEKYANVLIEKASKGLDVRLLVDDFNNVVINDCQVWLPLSRKREHIEARDELKRTRVMFHKMRSGGVDIRRTKRNHKKMVVIDKALGFLGGFNLSEHNFYWHDFAVKVEGSIITGLVDDFNCTWYKRSMEYKVLPEEDFLLGQGRNRMLRDYILEIIGRAGDSIYIESPYVSGKIVEKLKEAASRGVLVVVIIPQKNNLCNFFPLRYLERYTLSSIVDCGGKVYLYKGNGGMTHAKVMIIDDKLACFGSCNFDNLAFYYLEDLNLISRDASLIKALKTRLIETDVKQSEVFIAERMPFYNRSVGAVLSFLYQNILRC